MFFQVSGAFAGIARSFGISTIRSGVPMLHLSLSSNLRGLGMSAGSPLGAPESTHCAIVAISRSESATLFLNLLMPMFGSMCHGGMLRRTTFSLIAFAHGRASSYVTKDMGAIEPGRWQVWQDRWRMGATSFVKVACRSAAL